MIDMISTLAPLPAIEPTAADTKAVPITPPTSGLSRSFHRRLAEFGAMELTTSHVRQGQPLDRTVINPGSLADSALALSSDEPGNSGKATSSGFPAASVMRAISQPNAASCTSAHQRRSW
ncbi:MAG: hypothetical protein ACK4WH_07565 [Phycisphaerales bacterium]